MKHQTINVAGTDFVLVPAGEYDKLASRTVAGIELPPLPPADADGNRPAVAYARISIARDIIAQMNAMGVTAAQLSRDTGISPAALSHILKATRSPSEETVERIDKALAKRGRGETILQKKPINMNEAAAAARARKGLPPKGSWLSRHQGAK